VTAEVTAPLTGSRGSRRPVAMLVHSYYEEDPRVRREAEALVGAGRAVDVYGLRRPGDEAAAEIDGVRLMRLDVQRHQGAGLVKYLAEYLEFLVRAGLAVTRAHRRRHYALVQVHSLPDYLAFAALPLRLVGVPMLLDLHEAMPEFFRVRFPRASNPVVHGLLELQERASIAISSAVVTVNEALVERLVRLGAPPGKVHLVRNSPSLRRFDPTACPSRRFAEDGSLRLVYAGALSSTYELDVAIDALGRVAAARPELDPVLEVYGRDYGEGALAHLAAGLGVADRVRFHGRIPIETVPAAIAAADIGIAPTRRSPFTDFSLSTKLFEYGAMGKPVVASRLPMVERTFPSGEVGMYEPGDAEGLASAILRIVDDPAEREARITRMTARVRDLAWEREAAGYVSLVDRLARDPRPPAA
jgi:glycosyltransferase involved in cell wall biosynthesis